MQSWGDAICLQASDEIFFYSRQPSSWPLHLRFNCLSKITRLILQFHLGAGTQGTKPPRARSEDLCVGLAVAARPPLHCGSLSLAPLLSVWAALQSLCKTYMWEGSAAESSCRHVIQVRGSKS